MAKNTHANRYTRLIEAIFLKHYQSGATAIAFERDKINQTAEELGIVLPRTWVTCSTRFGIELSYPASILEKAPEGYEWMIKPAGRSRYSFVLVRQSIITPSPVLVETKIPNSTPGVIAKYVAP